MKRAVFLDRDGVLNRSIVRDGRPFAPTSLDDFELLPGVPEAAASLKAAGFHLVVVTNQPDVATGKQTRELVSAMHARLRQWLPLDGILTCFHTDAHQCECRKPKPGMLLAAARKWSLNLNESFLVGDRWRDIEAGHAAGCQTLFIDAGYRERLTVRPDWIVSSLSEAASIILGASVVPAAGCEFDASVSDWTPNISPR